jgi:hypothetical protein
MVVIRDQNNAGISFWYPLYWRRLLSSGTPLKVVDWERYRRWLPIRAASNIVLLGFGLALLIPSVYSDRLYYAFAISAIISTGVRLRVFWPNMRIRLNRRVVLSPSPLAAIDFSGTYLVLALLMFVYSSQADAEHASGAAAAIGSLFFVYGLAPLICGISFILGVGRRIP